MKDRLFGDVEFIGSPWEQAQLRKLVVCAILGEFFGRFDEAGLILSAVEPALADKPKFVFDHAMAHVLHGDVGWAMRVMNERLEQDPDDDIAKAMAGMAMIRLGDPDWRFVVGNVHATSPDPVARRVAGRTPAFEPYLAGHACPAYRADVRMA